MIKKEIKQDKESVAYSTGAVREDKSGKGRMDLVPISTLLLINDFKCEDLAFLEADNLPDCISLLKDTLCNWIIDLGDSESVDVLQAPHQSLAVGMLALSKHYEAGGILKGDHNWRKGLPIKLYFSAALRHYVQHHTNEVDMTFDNEYHMRAAVWNLSAALHTLIAINDGQLPASLLEGTLING